MAVNVQITRPGGGTTPVWSNFVDVMEHRAFTKHGSGRLADGSDATDAEIDLELAKYGAWSDWDDWDDPLWFPDEDSRAVFVLTYG